MDVIKKKPHTEKQLHIFSSQSSFHFTFKSSKYLNISITVHVSWSLDAFKAKKKSCSQRLIKHRSRKGNKTLHSHIAQFKFIPFILATQT